MSSYADILNQYASAIQGVEQGYANLYQDVVGGLQGTEASALYKEKLAFEEGQGKILASNVDRGLGNSTIQGSMQTGLLGKYAEATGATEATFAEKLANAKLGVSLPGLGFRGQAAQAYANLGGQFISEENRNALGWAQVAAQRYAAGLRAGGGGGGIYSEGPPKMNQSGGGVMYPTVSDINYGAGRGGVAGYGIGGGFGSVSAYGGDSPYVSFASGEDTSASFAGL